MGFWIVRACTESYTIFTKSWNNRARYFPLNGSLNKSRPTPQCFEPWKIMDVMLKNVGKSNWPQRSKKAFYCIHPTTIIPKCPPATIAFNTPGSPPPNLKPQKTLTVVKRKLRFIRQTWDKITLANSCMWLCSKIWFTVLYIMSQTALHEQNALQSILGYIQESGIVMEQEGTNQFCITGRK